MLLTAKKPNRITACLSIWDSWGGTVPSKSNPLIAETDETTGAAIRLLHIPFDIEGMHAAVVSEGLLFWGEPGDPMYRWYYDENCIKAEAYTDTGYLEVLEDMSDELNASSVAQSSMLDWL